MGELAALRGGRGLWPRDLPRHQRPSRPLKATSTSVWAAKLIVLTVILGAGVYLLNQERQIVRPGKTACVTNDPPDPAGCIPVIQGVPWAVLVVLVLLVGLTFVTVRTSFGRHIYAVGGNPEAARRAGISVKAIKIYCFMICSTLAAVAGVLIASRDSSVSPPPAARRLCCSRSVRLSSAGPASSAVAAGSSTPSSAAW